MEEKREAPRTPQGQPALSPEDQRHFEAYERKLQRVRNCIFDVVTGNATVCHIYGPDGVGKTQIAVEELRMLGMPYKLSSSRLTGADLLERLAKFRGHVHILDNVEQVLGDKLAVKVVRSVSWCRGLQNAGGRRGRQMGYLDRDRFLGFTFFGGIVLLDNREPDELPGIRDLLTRVPSVEFKPNDSEVAAKMRQTARVGYLLGDRMVSPGECRQVVEFVIQESLALGQPLDLRLLDNCVEAYLQRAVLDPGHDWKSLVRCLLEQRTRDIQLNRPPHSREGRRRSELELAREIANLPREEQFERWRLETGKNEATLYRRLAELG